MEDENIQIKTYTEANDKYEQNPLTEIEGKNINFGYKKDLSLSNITDKDGYTLIILHKTLKVDINNIKYMKLIVRMIKWLQGNKTLEKDIEIDHEKIIPFKEFNLNFLYFDIFKINEKLAFLLVFLFNKFYFFKICEKEEYENYILDYEELNVDKNNIKINEENIHLFVGNSIYDRNILEYVFLEKPKNNFIYLVVDLSSIDINSDELDCKTIKRSLDKNNSKKFKLKKYWRGLNNDKFIFIEDKSFQMLSKDDNDESKMLIYPFEIIYENSKIFPDKVPFLIKLLNKMYIIVDISKIEKPINSPNKQAIFATFEIYFDEERKIFSTKILQKIIINIDSKDDKFNLNRISTNKIMIIDDKIIYFFILNNNCLVQSIYQFNRLKLNQPKHSNKYYLNNDDKFFRVFIISPEKYSINCIIVNTNRNEEINSSNINISNYLYFNLNDYNEFINSTTKTILDNLKEKSCGILDKKYNSIKGKLRGENIETEKNENKVEKISTLVVETVEDIPQNERISKDDISNFKEKEKTNYKDNRYRYNQKRENKWPNGNQINYKNNNNKNKVPFYKNNQRYINNNINNNISNNINNNINNNIINNINNDNAKKMNNNFTPKYNINQNNDADWLKQLDKIKLMNQINDFNQYAQINNINNIQNKNNNINLMQNQINNNRFINPQIYQNFNNNYNEYY